MKRILYLLLLSVGLSGCATVPYEPYPVYDTGTVGDGSYYYDYYGNGPYPYYYGVTPNYPYYYPYDGWYGWAPSYWDFGFGFWGGSGWWNGHNHVHSGTGGNPGLGFNPGNTGHMNPNHGHMVGRGVGVR
jgi:hypothetical protein